MARLLLVFGVVTAASGWMMFAFAPQERARLSVPPATVPLPIGRTVAPAPREISSKPAVVPLVSFGDTRFRHPHEVRSQAFSSDGRFIATTTREEHTLRMWEVATGRLVWQHTEPLPAQPEGAEIVGYRPDGRWLVVLFGLRVAITFEAETGRVVSRFGVDPNAEPLFEPSPDWKLLAGRLGEGHLALWDLASGREVRRFTGLFHRYRIRFSPDGAQIAANRDGARVWWAPIDGSTPGREFPMPDRLDHMGLIAWSRADRLVMSDGQNWMVIDPTSGKEVVRRTRSGDDPGFLFQGPDGRLMGYLADNRRTEVSADTLKPIGAVTEVRDSRRFWTVASSDGRWISDPYGNAIEIRDAKTDKPLHPDLARHPVNPVTKFDFSADGKRMVTSDSRATAILWDTTTRSPLFSLGDARSNIHRASLLSPDGQWVIGSNKDGREIRSTTSGATFVREPPGNERLAWDYELGYDSDGCLWTRRGSSGAISQREMPFGKVVQTIPGLPVSDWSAALISPGGQKLVLGRHGALAARRTNLGAKWDVIPRPALFAPVDRTNRRFRAAFAHSTLFLAFTPNGRWLVVGETHQIGRNVSRLEVWDLRGRPVLITQWPEEKRDARTGLEQLLNASARERREGDDTCIGGVALSPDGRRLAFWVGTCWTHTNEVRVWETATWAEAYRFAPPGGLSAFGFVPGGRFITGRPDTTLSLWDGAAVERACLGAGEGAGGAALESPDPKVGLRAVHALAADPKRTVAVLATQFPSPDRAAIAARIGELADDDFWTRERASEALAALGVAAEPALREAMRSSLSPEVRDRVSRLLIPLSAPGGWLSPARLRAIRAVEVLERIASPEAQGLLRKWATDFAGTLLSAEANDALARLNSDRR